MLKSLYSGASGMTAQQMNLDNIANNLANVNTTAFKKTNLEFQDLIYQSIRAAGAQTGQESQTPTELQIGSGVKVAASSKSFAQGRLTETDNPLDVAINGEGFFRISLDDGSVAYSRDGHFKISSEGTIVTNDGYPIEPQITVPEDTESIMIGENGVVSVLLSGNTVPEEVGQLELSKFMNKGGLKSIGQNLYRATGASGEAVDGTPFSTGFGKLIQGYVEGSNVDLVQEMIGMIQTQRAYELGSKAISTSDEMLKTANQLKR